MVDLELGRNFFISPKLTLRPHFGFKGTWQTQQFNGKETFAALISQGDVKLPQGTEVDLEANNQYYWGLGVRTGLDTSWMFTRNWSLFADWAFSILWGQFKDTRALSRSLFSSTGAALLENYTLENVRFRAHQMSGVFETQIGFRYDYWFSDDDYRFRIQTGWEGQLWFEQNQFLNAPSGDLSLQGFTLNFRLDF